VTQPEPAGTIVDGVDIDAVHRVVNDCAGVARIGSGSPTALTTYLPGRRIPGIRINKDSVDLEVVAEWGTPAAAIGGNIRLAVSRLIGGRRVDITIADIELPSEQPSPGTVVSPPELQAAPERPALPPAPTHPPVVVTPER
jgi:hypothetical protein